MHKPSCFMLLMQLVRQAASRTFWTAGKSRPISTPMMAITTNSSISVKAWERTVVHELRDMLRPSERGMLFPHACGGVYRPAPGRTRRLEERSAPDDLGRRRA